MPTESRRTQELRQLLTDAIEVQLAAFKAGIGFWREWAEQASGFVKSASQSLRQINSPKHQPKEVLLELVDAGRASIRSMTELPRHTASRFIEALDDIQKKAQKGATPKRAATKGRTRRPKRAGRAKA